MTATFIFLWGLGGYYVLKWFGEPGDPSQAPDGQAIGDTLNSMTGGRLGFLMGDAKGADAVGKLDDHLHGGLTKGEIGTGEEKEGLMDGEEGGEKVKESVEQVKENASGTSTKMNGAVSG